MGTDKKPKTSPKNSKRKAIIIGGIIGISLIIIAVITIIIIQKNSNEVSGRWACAKYSDETDAKEEVSTSLVLNADGTYQFGDYNDLNNNHYAGKYSYTREDKPNATEGINYYTISFDSIDEFVIEGKTRTTSENMLDKAEFDINSDKTQAILMFTSAYVAYFCENK